MSEKPVTTYIVSVFEKPHWRTVLTTTDINKALAKAKEIGEQVRIERRVQDAWRGNESTRGVVS